MATIASYNELPEAPFYAMASDRFMSGWGEAVGKTNLYVIPCPTAEAAEIAADNLRARSEMRHPVTFPRARALATLERRFSDGKHVISINPAPDPAVWFTRGYFKRQAAERKARDAQG